MGEVGAKLAASTSQDGHDGAMLAILHHPYSTKWSDPLGICLDLAWLLDSRNGTGRDGPGRTGRTATDGRGGRGRTGWDGRARADGTDEWDGMDGRDGMADRTETGREGLRFRNGFPTYLIGP